MNINLTVNEFLRWRCCQDRGTVNGRGNIEYIIDMGEQIGRKGGQKGTGAALNRVMIVIDRSSGENRIVTAYSY